MPNMQGKIRTSKASLTKIEKYLMDEDSDFSLTTVETKQKILEPLFQKFEDAYYELELEKIKEIDGEESSLDIDDTEFLDFQERFYNAQSKLTAIIRTCAERVQVLQPLTDDIAGTHNNHGRDIGIKTPKIDIGKFSGKVDDWIRFYENFKTIIHDNLTIKNKICKFHYLISLLEGEAAHFIDGIDISEENYDFAWEKLVGYYKNNKILAETHISNLFNIKKLESQSAKGLRDLHNAFIKNLNALKKLGETNASDNIFVVYLMTSKLDNLTLRKWEEETAAGKEVPKFEDLEYFLINHYNSLEAYERKSGEIKINPLIKGKRVSVFMAHKPERPDKCPGCDTPWHPLYKCRTFLRKSIEERKALIKKYHFCFQCLGAGHSVQSCQGRLCSKCGTGKHNYLICQKTTSSQTARDSPQASFETTTSSTLCATVRESPTQTSVFFPTCVVKLFDKYGRSVFGRFLLDSASELNFVTQKLADRLKLNFEKDKLRILGVGGRETASYGYIKATIKAQTSQYTNQVHLYILPEITQGNLLTAAPISANFTNIPNNIYPELADPDFIDAKRKIDGILGVGIFFDVLRQTKFHPMDMNSTKLNYLQPTAVGWVVCGEVGSVLNDNTIMEKKCFLSLTLPDLEDEKVITRAKKRILEDNLAEKCFEETVKIGVDGRFIVALPIKEEPGLLGNSWDGAKKRFIGLERRFLKEPLLKKQYSEFISEYLTLEHMEEVPQNEIHDWPNYYLPHHAIFKESSTTKLRVVFDASYRTLNGKSLNDISISGPALQNDVFNILVSFRFPKYGLTGDIEKMYRQIWVDENFRNLQRILWRDSPDELLRHYRLKTITYGTKSAPFLAIRCLHHIADSIRHTEPDLAEIIKRKFFMDDYLDGADTLEELRIKQSRLEQIFKERGMNLRKWVSNSMELMNELKRDMENHYSVDLSEDDTVSTLGLAWNPKTDNLIVQVHDRPSGTSVTKRSILSDLHSFWDPIGLLSPALVKGRMFLQELWRVSVGWDEDLPEHLKQKWTTFRSGLHEIHGFQIPRRVLINDTVGLEFHGFSDASEKAYGACIYVRTWDTENNYSSYLVCAESHIAPLKEVTLPRLELLGAFTLARLMEKVIVHSNYNHCKKHYYTDSEIVLAWISGCPQQWTRYVANRVSLIQEMTDTKNWHHVTSAENPADVVSRGVKAARLKDCCMWWNGPTWLRNQVLEWPIWKGSQSVEQIPETRKITFSLVSVKTEAENLFKNYSSWRKLIRIMAWILRFKYNCLSHVDERRHNRLTIWELQESKNLLIKCVQSAAFPDEMTRLTHNQPLAKSSRLLSLDVFMNECGLMKVGGRLANSCIPDARKFPIILPYKSHITELIIRDFHERNYHIGPQTLLTVVRGEYWPLNGKSAAKSIVRNCITCRRAAPKPLQPKMASLPKDRITPARPFEVTGVDFCGPIYIKSAARRSVKRKAYVAVFICFTTKAIHLELVTDLSSRAFLAALRRFVARRGKSRVIYSDNGTNFVGAQKELSFFCTDDKIKSESNNEGIDWKFIPPGAPHFGGLWESAVKLMKFHLKRTMDKMVMTYEETYTTLTGIEACLNSRPLTPLSDDPNDPTPLTPSHFLIGGNLNTIPEPDFTKQKLTRRWQLVQQFVQQFWKRWNTEYLSGLQQRNKWRSQNGELKTGTLVAVKTEGVKPTEWRMARVVALHPGNDGIARVATVIDKTGRQTIRPVNKLCPILSEN